MNLKNKKNDKVEDIFRFFTSETLKLNMKPPICIHICVFICNKYLSTYSLMKIRLKIKKIKSIHFL